MATINIKLDFLICETSINTFLCKFYYWDNVNSRIMPWTAQQSTKQDSLALMQTYSNDLYTALLNIEGITPLGGGSVTDYGTYSEMSFDLVVDTGSQSQDVDYTQILTSINSNLASIAAKNNQSNIVDCLNNIFCYQLQNGSFVSSFKDNLQYQSANDTYKRNMTFCNLLYHIFAMFKSSAVAKNDFSADVSSRVLDNISKKLSYSTPVSDTDSSIFRILRIIALALCNNSSVNLSNDSSIISNSSLKAISDKLANATDLHTISQAIDLISTAIAQTNNTLTNTNTDLCNIATNINSIQSNPLIEVNIDVPYEVKNLTKKDTEY